MPLEIERKFLVKGEFKSHAFKCEHIVQGYLSSNPERAVRVRIKDDKGYLTIKGKSDDAGVLRFEWETEIAAADAQQLIELCEPGIIDKKRYCIQNGDLVFEVDEFEGDNVGLVIAEIELESESQAFDRPQWLGDEVTGDARYYNSALVKHPYIKW